MPQAQARTQESFEQSYEQSNEQSNEQLIPNFVPAEIVEFGKKRVDALIEMQKNLFDAFQEINQAWLARAQSEASLNSELVAKLTAARTVPETTDACQESMGKRMELFVEDSRRLLADSQKIMNLGTRFLTSGASGNGSLA